MQTHFSNLTGSQNNMQSSCSAPKKGEWAQKVEIQKDRNSWALVAVAINSITYFNYAHD